MNTVFSKIIAGEIPATKVYEDEYTLAFLDANPVNPGHTLVIPKREYENMYDIPEDELRRVMQTVKRLAPVVKEAVGADGINIGQNNESAAGQEVFHFHVHIIPRFAGDGFSHWRGAEDYHAGDKANIIAQNIRQTLS